MSLRKTGGECVDHQAKHRGTPSRHATRQMTAAAAARAFISPAFFRSFFEQPCLTCSGLASFV
eukprot:scaffold47630_cov19-Tisochrysis_lutea.AAC.2